MLFEYKTMYATVHQLVPYMHLRRTQGIEYRVLPTSPITSLQPIMMRTREGDLAAGVLRRN